MNPKEVEIGDWLLVWFKISRSTKIRKYICQMIKERKGELVGKFVRVKCTKKDTRYIYSYPDIPDVSTFSFCQIIQKIEKPIPHGRYGLLKFNIHVSKLV